MLGPSLVCGTQNGLLRCLDMGTGAVVASSQSNSNYVSDVCVKGEAVVSVDWYGQVTRWTLRPGSEELVARLEEEGAWEVPRLLAAREVERLLDFSEEYLVTTFKCHLTCYRHTGSYHHCPVNLSVVMLLS